MKKLSSLLIYIVFLYTLSPPSLAQTTENKTGASGFPLPRFASLDTDKINLRTGPGTRYPIEWVYVREGLPVEITAEFDVWRRVRDWEGSEGWLHQSALTGKRMAIVTGSKRTLYKAPSTTAAIAAYVAPNALGAIKSCEPQWCKIEFGSITGYLPKTDFWGAYSAETFDN